MRDTRNKKGVSSKERRLAGEVESFEDLLAWKLAFDLAARIYKVTERFPAAERFGLTSQLCRAASSIPANIAEGFGRHTPKDYLRFLIFARGSIAETQSHLRLADTVGLLNNTDLDNLCHLCLQARKTLQGLIRYIRQRAEASGVAEPSAEYPEPSADDSQLSTLNSQPESNNDRPLLLS